MKKGCFLHAYLYAKLPDAAEALEWKAKIEAEAARLDAARANFA